MAGTAVVKQHGLRMGQPRDHQRVVPDVDLYRAHCPPKALRKRRRHVIRRHAIRQVVIQVHCAKAAHEQVHGRVEVLGDAAVRLAADGNQHVALEDDTGASAGGRAQAVSALEHWAVEKGVEVEHGVGGVHVPKVLCCVGGCCRAQVNGVGATGKALALLFSNN